MSYPLPQELTRIIIGHLPDDKRQLQACSLVARSWVQPSQTRLLESVKSPVGKLQSRLCNIPREKLKYIHQLTCVGEGFFLPLSDQPVDLEALRHHFDYLSELRHLKCHMTQFTPSSQDIVFFSAFKDTLSTVTLSSCTVSICGLATVIDYFKNLKSLHLKSLWKILPIQHPEKTTLSLRTFEKLSIRWRSLGLPDALIELSKMELRFDEVAFECASLADSDGVPRIFGASVKRVRWMNTTANGMCDLLCFYCVNSWS